MFVPKWETSIIVVATATTKFRDWMLFLMLPPRHLDSIVRYTTAELEEKSKKKTTKGEILKFFGIVLLTTKFEFKSRASLWSTTAPSKYKVAPAFGQTGMSRQRFDYFWMRIRFSNQPKVRPPEMSSERYRSTLLDDFVFEYNNHRKRFFIPSEMLCVDESISRWYGQGGEWINKGLPMYVAIDRKPENGCDPQRKGRQEATTSKMRTMTCQVSIW